jgi:hypothetical protein
VIYVYDLIQVWSAAPNLPAQFHHKLKVWIRRKKEGKFDIAERSNSRWSKVFRLKKFSIWLTLKTLRILKLLLLLKGTIKKSKCRVWVMSKKSATCIEFTSLQEKLTHSGAIPLDTSPDSDNFLLWHLNSWITLL